MCILNLMLCNKLFMKLVFGCVYRYECYICGLNGDLIFGRVWVIGFGVVFFISFVNVSLFIGVVEIVLFLLV